MRKLTKRKRGEQGFAALATAWDRMHGLRVGDRVCLDGKVAAGHLRRWKIDGMLRLGFQGVGKHAVGFADSVGASTHNLDAVIATSMLCDKAQKAAFHRMLDEALERDPRIGLCIIWGHDATPWVCHFGQLQEQCYQFARYLCKDESLFLKKLLKYVLKLFCFCTSPFMRDV